MSASGQMGYNDLAHQWEPRGAFLISDTFLDGRLGVLASVAYGRRSLYEEGFSSVRWDGGNSVGGFCSPVGHVPLNPTTGGANCGASGSTAGGGASCRGGAPPGGPGIVQTAAAGRRPSARGATIASNRFACGPGE